MYGIKVWTRALNLNNNKKILNHFRYTVESKRSRLSEIHLVLTPSSSPSMFTTNPECRWIKNIVNEQVCPPKWVKNFYHSDLWSLCRLKTGLCTKMNTTNTDKKGVGVRTPPPPPFPWINSHCRITGKRPRTPHPTPLPWQRQVSLGKGPPLLWIVLSTKQNF